MRLLDKLKSANKAVEPEDSIPVRVAVFVAVMASVVALAAEDVAGSLATVAAFLLIPVGFWVSHQFRSRESFALKAGLAVALVLVLVDFLSALGPVVGGDVTAVQIPLAEVFLWVQILHALHVPARRDLMFGLAASGVTFAVVGVFSLSLQMAPFLAMWVLGSVAALVLGHRDDIRSVGTLVNAAGPSAAVEWRAIGRVAGLLAVTVLGVFVLLPAASTSRALAFPVSLPSVESVASPGGLSNPSLGQANPQSGGSGDAQAFDSRASFGYFGFADQLDTGLRGRPDDTLVMRVRAPGPDFWRGQSFDTWDGRTWTASSDETRAINGANPLLIPGTTGDGPAAGEDFVQTFYLERPGPNVVFAAQRPVEVYFPDGRIFQTRDGALRASVELGSGAVYTVVSSRQPVTADMLRQADPLVHGVPPDVAATYLQLPETPQRVLDLASEVTAGHSTTYDKIRALETWMATNTTYSLDIPALPAGVDATEHYLFMTQQGFCEQIGTSLVVMLRSLGIPARLAVGYVPGERNPLTGMFEVRASDAHSWTEVWFPGVGWQSFDPTAKVPLAGESGRLGAASGMIEWLQARLPGFMDTGSELLVFGGGLAALVGLFVLARTVARQWAYRRRLSAYESLVWRIERLGSRAGGRRVLGETLVEYGNRLGDAVLMDRDVSSLTADVTAWTFSGGDPNSTDVLYDRMRRIERRHREIQSPVATLSRVVSRRG